MTWHCFCIPESFLFSHFAEVTPVTLPLHAFSLLLEKYKIQDTEIQVAKIRGYATEKAIWVKIKSHEWLWVKEAPVTPVLHSLELTQTRLLSYATIQNTEYSIHDTTTRTKYKQQHQYIFKHFSYHDSFFQSANILLILTRTVDWIQIQIISWN